MNDQEANRRKLAVRLAQELRTDYLYWCLKMNLEQDTIAQSDSNPVDRKHLGWMCDQVISHEKDWSCTRLHRWVGFIQAGFMVHGIITLDTERNRVRDLKEEFPED
jgi:hypothetical protein